MFQCYKRILELDPVNIQGMHNLCVVFVERGKLLQAEECLENAHKLAPEEDYVLRHLQIVRNRIAKLNINSSEQEDLEKAPKDGQVVSNKLNKTKDESEKKTQPVVSKASDNQQYSSHVVNTEPVFVNNHELVSEEIGGDNNRITEESKRAKRVRGRTDRDDPSSGMS